MTNKEKTDEIGRMYILYDALESIALDLENNIEYSPSNIDEEELEKSHLLLLYYNQQLTFIINRIEELRKEFLAFSRFEVYNNFGRYDKFISINFHYNSESAREFGRTIMGIPIYNRREREDIEIALQESPISRTNGYVRFDASEINNLSQDKIDRLYTKGFPSGDICTIHYTPLDLNDKFSKKGEKEIPNTIKLEVPFDDSFNAELLGLKLYQIRIEDNSKPLISNEWDEYFAYRILYAKENISGKEWLKIYKPNSNIIKDRIHYYMLRSKLRRRIEFTEKETKDFIYFFKQRKERTGRLVDKEINKSDNKKLKDIIATDKELYQEIRREAFAFEPINLSPHGSEIAIYLDLERYLHIFVRHCNNFQIGSWKNGGKLAFPYSFKDIQRLLKKAVEELMPKIEVKLKQGKEFNIFDKRAYYFNGNYYVIHIDKNGRFLSFYPHTNPE